MMLIISSTCLSCSCAAWASSGGRPVVNTHSHTQGFFTQIRNIVVLRVAPTTTVNSLWWWHHDIENNWILIGFWHTSTWVWSEEVNIWSSRWIRQSTKFHYYCTICAAWFAPTSFDVWCERSLWRLIANQSTCVSLHPQLLLLLWTPSVRPMPNKCSLQVDLSHSQNKASLSQLFSLFRHPSVGRVLVDPNFLPVRLIRLLSSYNQYMKQTFCSSLV